MKTDTKLTPEKVFGRYHDGVRFNAKIKLDEEVEQNENFFVGK